MAAKNVISALFGALAIFGATIVMLASEANWLIVTNRSGNSEYREINNKTTLLVLAIFGLFSTIVSFIPKKLNVFTKCSAILGLVIVLVGASYYGKAYNDAEKEIVGYKNLRYEISAGSGFKMTLVGGLLMFVGGMVSRGHISDDEEDEAIHPFYLQYYQQPISQPVNQQYAQQMQYGQQQYSQSYTQYPHGNMQTYAQPYMIDPRTISYHVVIDSQVRGPYNFEELSSMAANGTLTKDTQVWKKGMKDFKRAGKVGELIPILNNYIQ